VRTAHQNGNQVKLDLILISKIPDLGFESISSSGSGGKMDKCKRREALRFPALRGWGDEEKILYY
jgi:hypothetical protein